MHFTNKDAVKQFHQQQVKSINTYHSRGFGFFTQNTTTMHGLKFVTDSSIPLLNRVAWAILLVFLTVFAFYMIFMSLVKYVTYSSISRTENILSTELHQPSITLCNYNFGKGSALAEHYPIIYDIGLNNLLQIVNQNSTESDFYSKMLQNISFMEYATNIANTIEDMFIHCEFASVKINCSDYFEPFQTEKGLCYTFNSKARITTKGPIIIPKTGPSNGLTLTLDVQSEEYYSSSQLGYGFFILVHDPYTFPMLEEKGFVIAPGMETMVAVQRNINIRLPKPYSISNCIDTSKEIHANYSMENCQFNNLLKNVFNKPCEILFTDFSKACTLYDLQPAVDTNPIVGNQLEDCLPVCKEIFYSSRVTMSGFPSIITQKYAMNFWPTQNITYIKHNYAHVKFYFDTFYTTKSEQVPEETFISMVGTIGGQLGLCVGASIVTIVEFMEYAVVQIRRRIQKFANLRGKKTVVTNFVPEDN